MIQKLSIVTDFPIRVPDFNTAWPAILPPSPITFSSMIA